MGILNFVKDLFDGKKPKKKTAKKVKKAGKKKPSKIKSKKKAIKKPEKPSLGKVVGVVTHHFAKIQVGVIKLKAELKVGDTIHIKGVHDDFKQVIKSMQINHKDVQKAKKGVEIGIKVKKPVHENDKVYMVPRK